MLHYQAVSAWMCACERPSDILHISFIFPRNTSYIGYFHTSWDAK